MSSRLTLSQNDASCPISSSAPAARSDSGCTSRYVVSEVCAGPRGRASIRKRWFGMTLTARFGKIQANRGQRHAEPPLDRKSTRLNSSHVAISYAVFCLKKKKKQSKTTKKNNTT